eukprot:scaffold54272_cov66-Phaeocystis_antarctica.AAC.5
MAELTTPGIPRTTQLGRCRRHKAVRIAGKAAALLSSPRFAAAPPSAREPAALPPRTARPPVASR